MGTEWEQHSLHRVIQRVLSSRNMTEMDEMTSHLLTGQVTSQDLPSVTSRLIRVFLCTTALDTFTERTAFVEYVYPKLREYCRQHYGLEFQMVDLAWGLTIDQLDQADPEFAALKLQEIERCQTVSCGPSIVAFVGQKYGPLPLPTTILASDYQVAYSAVLKDRSRDTRNADIIDQFYIIDTNSVPPVYVLRPDLAIPELNDDDEEVRQDAKEQWEETQVELRRLLQKGARLAFNSGVLDTDGKERFFWSALDREIRQATEEQCERQDMDQSEYISNSDSRELKTKEEGGGSGKGDSCLLVLRNIVDLHNYLQDPRAPCFIEMTPLLVPESPAGPPSETSGDNQPILSVEDERNISQFKAQPRGPSVSLPAPIIQEICKANTSDENRTRRVSSSTISKGSGETFQLSGTPHTSETCPRCLKTISAAHRHSKKTNPLTARKSEEQRREMAVDEVAEAQLMELRERVRGAIPDANTLSKEVLWRYEEVISPTLHQDYLQELCTETYNVLKRQIDESSQTLEHLPVLDAEAQECLQHWTHCRSLTRDVCPDCHIESRQQLRNYITGLAGYPLFLCGKMGCGKTKLVSTLAMELSQWTMPPGRRLVSTIRYVGLTCWSTKQDHLLYGLCRHICAVLGHDASCVPRDLRDLRRFFTGLLFSIVPAEVLLVVIVDGLEKLQGDAALTDWIPTMLPSHVKIILTLSPDHPDFTPVVDRDLENMVHENPEVVALNEFLKEYSEECVLDMPPLSSDEATLLLEYFLTTVNRQLTSEQLEVLGGLLEQCSLPLYVKLLALQVQSLHSYTALSPDNLPRDTEEAVQCFLDRLEASHGRDVVPRVLAYLAASQSGLSEMEMEDLLSLDDTMLSAVYCNHQQAIRRVPCIVWLKLRRDLEPFLLLQQAEGAVTVTVWEHDAFPHAIAFRYFTNVLPPSENDHLLPFHSLLADYFLGLWAGKGKPVEMPAVMGGVDEGEEDFCQFPCGTLVDCLVPLQPHLFQAGSSSRLGELEIHDGTAAEPSQNAAGTVEWGQDAGAAAHLGRNSVNSVPQGHDTANALQQSCDSANALQQGCDSVNSLQQDLDAAVAAERQRASSIGSTKHLWVTDESSSTDDQAMEGSAEEVQNQTRLNKRMYSQLPLQLNSAGRKDELNQLVLFNYRWIFNKIQGFSIADCMEDYLLNPGYETALVRTALQEASHVLEKDLYNLAAELSGRLLPYCATQPWIRTLVRSCDVEGLEHCVLLPSFPYHEIPGSPLEHTLDCGFVPQSMSLVHNGAYLLCKRWDSSQVLVWDLTSAELKDTIVTSLGELYVTPDGRFFVIREREMDRTFKIHNSGSGKLMSQVIPLNCVDKGDPLDPNRTQIVCVSDCRLLVVLHLCRGPVLLDFQVPSGRHLIKVELGDNGPATVCAFTAPPSVDMNTTHVLCSSGDILRVYSVSLPPAEDKHSSNVLSSSSNRMLLNEVESMEETHSIPLPATKPHLLEITADGRLAVLAFLPDRVVTLHLNYGTDKMQLSPLPTEVWLDGDVVRAVRVAPDDQHFLVRSDNHVLVYKMGQKKAVGADLLSVSGLENADEKFWSKRPIAHFVRPAQMPQEYRLPGRHYRSLVFSEADFCAHSIQVLAAILRRVYIWSIAEGCLITTIQTPVGLTTTLLVTKPSNQLVTHNQGSRHVMVWRHVITCPDSTHLQQERLTRPVERLLVTSDQRLAFAQCLHSDEIGVFDMSTGLLVHLLTHPCKVLDMAITPTGDVILVVTKARLSGTACRLWYLPKRKVIKEWGDSGGICLSLNTTPSIALFSQPPSYQAPFTLTMLNLCGGGSRTQMVVIEEVRPGACQYVTSRPVVTRDDRFIIVSSALGWDTGLNKYESPCLVVFDREMRLKSQYYDTNSVGMAGVLEDILQLEASPLERSSVILVVSIKRDPESEEAENSQKVGLITLDLKLGTLTRLLFLMLEPPPLISSPTPTLLFSVDLVLCLDQASTIYNLLDGLVLPRYLQPPSGLPPVCHNGTHVIYYEGSTLYVMRITDACLVARCEVHAQICLVILCRDQCTLLVGCKNGTLASYVIVDPMLESCPSVVDNIPSRQFRGGLKEEEEPDHSEPDKVTLRRRRWDRVEMALGSAYSRPSSALSSGPGKEILALRNVQPIARIPPRTKESILRPIPCKCVRLNAKGQWERVKVVQVGFRR